MTLSPQALKVQLVLADLGLQLQVIELPESTRTSQEAAQALGCQVGQIAKSIIFEGQASHKPVLVVASGINRVDEKFIARLVGEPVGKAGADFVHLHTGFAIGGVPPVGHTESIKTFIDRDLLQYSEIWAAAGTPHAVFRLAPGDLLRMIQGEVISVKG
jgi:prolyl-tRNA editing enzyme YbaK/EbsC (Cys-tRNA(Pro) deacylase)